MSRPTKDGAAPSRPARTLKRLAREAEALDRHNAALKPSAVDGASNHPSFPPVIPRTIDQLRASCGDFGEAAVVSVRWGAVMSWLMRDFDNPGTAAVPEGGRDAARIMREYDRYRLDWPSWQGRDHRPPAPEYLSLSPDDRTAIEKLAKETMAIWERDGGRYLSPAYIKAEYQYVTSCEAYRDRYGQPGDDKPIDNQENAA